MNVNYDKMFEEIKTHTNGARLLLHVCCAPCATQCLTRLLDTFDVTLFYSNDNIAPPAEWEKRLGEVEKLVEIVNNGEFEVKPKFSIKLEIHQLDSAAFFGAARGLENEPEGGARCSKCFALRLGDTFSFARAHEFDFFGTTLTVSPYKNSRILNETGYRLSGELPTEKVCAENPDVKWLPADFKKHNGYNESIRLSQKYGLYRQHYCGCAFSLASAER